MTSPSLSTTFTIVSVALLLQLSKCFVTPASRIARIVGTQHHISRATTTLFAGPTQHDHDVEEQTEARASLRSELLSLLKETPSNAPTSRKLTKDILSKIDELETKCPTPEQDVLGNLAGNWELLWTAQDTKSTEWRNNPFRSWINPLENQAYSNNPDGDTGRSNPFLPRRIQDRLERLGLNQGSARSSQLVDLEKERVRNIVTFQFPGRRKRQATLIVDIKFKPTSDDSRRVDVRFQACRLIVPNTRIKANFPLGPLGPKGWLRTDYIDEALRITRGHKGSVFVLARANANLYPEEDVEPVVAE